MNNKVGVGLIGSQFVTSIHAESLRSVADAEIIAVMSPSEGHAADFAKKHPDSSSFQQCGRDAGHGRD